MTSLIQLHIGNKNYSSWSMRPWVLMRQLGIGFEEVMIRFDGFGPDSNFKRATLKLYPLGKVPVLNDDGLVIWDTLAIIEYLAERFPGAGVWPRDRRLRARARSLCNDMHSGFSALRSHCPMNIEADLREVGQSIWAQHEAVRSDVQLICRMWEERLDACGKDRMLMGEFCALDAFYAPVVMRLHTYQLPVSDRIRAYMDRVREAPGVRAWIEEALAEQDFLPFEEPYRSHR